MSNQRAQTSVEFMLLFGVLLIVGLVLTAILSMPVNSSSDSRITASSAYWAREAHPLQVRSASLSYSLASSTANLSLVIHNTANSDLTLRQIIISPGTFGPVYYFNGTQAGTISALSVLLAPDEETSLYLPAIIPWGANPPKTGDFSLTLDYDSALGPGVENGSTPLVVVANSH